MLSPLPTLCLLRGYPDFQQALVALARGCDLVLPSRFKKWLQASARDWGRTPAWGLSIDTFVRTGRGVAVWDRESNVAATPAARSPSRRIPAFFFPLGRTQAVVDVDAAITFVELVFLIFPLYLISHGNSGRNGTCSRQNYSSYYGCCDAKILTFPQKCHYGKHFRIHFDRNGHKGDDA
ncbi:hypothetical protein STEG23_033273 [Scotinomys teguina]